MADSSGAKTTRTRAALISSVVTLSLMVASVASSAAIAVRSHNDFVAAAAIVSGLAMLIVDGALIGKLVQLGRVGAGR